MKFPCFLQKIRSDKKKLLWFILLLVGLIVFISSAIALLLRYLPKKPEPAPVPSQVVSGEETQTLPPNPIDFAALREENPDIIGWISLPGCEIDYPILQSSEEEAEDFYLDHNRSKQFYSAGAIYIQKLNHSDFSDPNTVIYGHNMLNGSMFGRLKKFRGADFFAENDTITITIPGHILTYRVYSAFVYDDRHILNSFNFSAADEFAAFLDATLNPKTLTKNVREGVSVTTDDRIITLSTCTGSSVERYLVEGVLIDDQLTR